MGAIEMRISGIRRPTSIRRKSFTSLSEAFDIGPDAILPARRNGVVLYNIAEAKTGTLGARSPAERPKIQTVIIHWNGENSVWRS